MKKPLIYNLILWICLLFSSSIFGQQTPNFTQNKQHQEILATLDQFFSSWNTSDEEKMQQLIHPELGFYYTRATNGIEIQHRTTVDFTQEPFDYWYIDSVQFTPIESFLEDNQVFWDTDPIFDCYSGVYYSTPNNYCQKRNELGLGLYISELGTIKRLTDYIEIYSQHQITSPDGTVLHFDPQKIDEDSPYYPEQCYFCEGDHVIDSNLHSQLDKFATLERNSVLIRIIGSNAFTEIELINIDGKWYIFVLDRFYSYCSGQAIIDSLDYYQCSSNNTVN